MIADSRQRMNIVFDIPFLWMVPLAGITSIVLVLSVRAAHNSRLATDLSGVNVLPGRTPAQQRRRKPLSIGRPEHVATTLRDYFESDFRDLSVLQPMLWSFIDHKTGQTVRMGYTAKHIFCAETRCEFLSYYIPSHKSTFRLIETLPFRYKRSISKGDAGDCSASTGRAYVYHEDPLSEQQIKQLMALFHDHGLSLTLRSPTYAVARNATRDKTTWLGARRLSD